MVDALLIIEGLVAVGIILLASRNILARLEFTKRTEGYGKERTRCWSLQPASPTGIVVVTGLCQIHFQGLFRNHDIRE